MALTVGINWTGGIKNTNGERTFRSRFGVSATPSGEFALASGTGSGQANVAYEATFSILTTATLEIDLKGATGEKDVDNAALDIDTVKGIEIILTTAPASGVSLRLGPQGLTNANQLWFSAKTAGFYDTVRDRMAKFDRATGWAVDATNKIVGLHNPGAGTVAGWIRIIGVT